MTLGVRDIKIKFTGDTSGLDKASATGEKQLSKWQSGFQKFNKVAVPAALAVGAAAIKVGKDSVELSRKISDMDAKASAVFGGQLGKVNKWAEGTKRAFGLSRRETVGLAANFADLLKPMGFTAAEAANMSTEVLDLSGALAKWSGGQYEAAEVSEILSKAMLGEREQLKSLGISITEADVKARLAKNGQEKLTGAALQQAKAIATQQLIMEKSTDAQAAWANGGRKAAESENAMSTSIQELREKLATVLGPAIEKGTELLAKFAGWAEKNQGVVIALGGVLLGMAAAVFAVNAAVKVWSAATKVATGVQWLLNAALRANPIGIVITIIAALIAIIILAWKRSETFRRIVTTAFNAVKNAAKFAWNWIKQNWPLLLAIITGPIGLAVLAVVRNWDRIKSAVSNAVNGIKGFLSGMWDGMVSGAKAAVNGAISIINGAIGGINTLIDGANFLPGVSIPHVPSIPFLAKGGIVTRPTLVMIGEAGKEAVVPLDRADEFGMGGGPQVIENHIHIGDEVVKVVRTEIKGHDRGLRRRAAMA